MKGIFDYDSPLMQVLGFIADLFILNLVFLACCLPIVTIGAAQSGLFNAMRVLQDREDDSSVLKAFFRGFKNGFFRITPVWIVFLVLDVIMVYTVLMTLTWAAEGIYIHWAFPTIILALLLLLQSVVPAFHARFSCSPVQLVRNSMLMVGFHPLRSLGLAVLLWAPAAVALFKPVLFVQITPLFFTVYYSTVYLMGALFMKKPFDQLIENFYSGDEEEKEAEQPVN